MSDTAKEAALAALGAAMDAGRLSAAEVVHAVERKDQNALIRMLSAAFKGFLQALPTLVDGVLKFFFGK